MMTAINRTMLVALVPAFMLSALGVGLWEGCRGSWSMWRAMWREAEMRPDPRRQQNAGMLDLTPDTLAYGQRIESP